MNSFGVNERELENTRMQLVKDLKQYCKDNPDNCEKEKLGIYKLDPANWGWKRKDMESLGMIPENKIRTACQDRLKVMFLNN